MDWDAHAQREEGRYADGLDRLPDEADARQKQLVRMAMAATGAGLVRLMQGRRAEAAGWFTRSAERFRESYADAPEGSWGRLIGAVKARVLAGGGASAEADAAWALAQGSADGESPIGRYAAALALLVLGRDDDAAAVSSALLEAPEEAFPRPVAETLAALAVGDGDAYRNAVARVLESFESREEYLEGIPVADTVIVLQVLAERRGIAAALSSPLLPGKEGS